MSNVLELLKIEEEREKKRREKAIGLLDELVEQIAPSIAELEGVREEHSWDDDYTIIIPKWNKEKGKYIVPTSIYDELYFRYETHHGTTEREKIGFYVSRSEIPVWGTNLNKMKGKNFWKCIKQITDWVENYLAGYVEKHVGSRDKRLYQLEKIVEKLR